MGLCYPGGSGGSQARATRRADAAAVQRVAQRAAAGPRRHRASCSACAAPGVVSGAASLPYVTPGIGAQSFAELDEALDSLPSQPSARSGAELVQAALSRALPDATSLIHFFDPSTNEFVVVCASGPWSSRALSMRTLHRQPPFSLLAGRQSPQRFGVAHASELARAARWHALGTRPAYLLAGLLHDRRRLLGAVELARPAEAGDFIDAEVTALAHVCERFAQFLAERPLEFQAVVVADK
jgi:GAF domain-containing protein